MTEAKSRRLLLAIGLVMAGVFLLDLLLPRDFPLLPFYFLLVVLSAGIATPRQMVPLIAEAFVFAITSGFYWGFFPSISYSTRLVGLSGVTAVALYLSAKRVRAEQQQRRTEQILNLSLYNAATGVALADANGIFFRVNPALCAMFGRSEDELLQRSWMDSTHPDEIAQEQPLIEAVLANRRQSYRLQKWIPRSDGRTIWLDLNVSCARKPDGTVDFFIGQGTDITAQVEAQRALAESEERFRLLAENTADVVLHVDAGGIIRWVSPSLQPVLGLDPSAWMDRHLLELLSELGSDLSAIRQVNADGESHISCEQVRDGSGRLRWIEAHWSPFRNAAGEPDGEICSFRIIDARRAAELELQQRACTDSLTGLLNREEMFRLLQPELQRQRRGDERLAVLFCDLDHFKEINDNCGHQAGDAVLVAMAQRIRSCLRDSDLAARMGGDEMVVALSDVRDQDEAAAIADRIRRLASQPVTIPGGEACVTLSIGVALAQPGEDIDALMALADAAMYAAKQRGRDQVVTISADPPG